MDVRMPRMDGIEATREILALAPQVRIIVLTTFDLNEYALEGIQTGASGFLLKDALPDVGSFMPPGYRVQWNPRRRRSIAHVA